MTSPALTADQRAYLEAEGVPPEGWRWCPDCNGEGIIWTMDPTPNLDEHQHACTTCAATMGVVPDA